MNPRPTAIALLPALLHACASTPGSSGRRVPVEGPYDASFVTHEAAWTGVVEVRATDDGDTRWRIAIDEPMVVTGDATGRVAGSSHAWSGTYENLDNGCGGTIDGAGEVAPDGREDAGTFHIEDRCGGALSGTYTLVR